MALQERVVPLEPVEQLQGTCLIANVENKFTPSKIIALIRQNPCTLARTFFSLISLFLSFSAFFFLFKFCQDNMSELLLSRYFPSYRQLPPDELTVRVWLDLDARGRPPVNEVQDAASVVDPRRHWCLMVEIVENRLVNFSSGRHLLMARDREGAHFQMLFILEPNDPLDLASLKKGSTVFLRYATQQWFQNTSHGVCVEDSTHVYIVPCSLSEILQVHRTLSSPRTCNRCGQTCTKRCDRCKSVYYRQTRCQTEDWKDHSPICRVLTLVAPVVGLTHCSLKRVPKRGERLTRRDIFIPFR